MSRRPITTSSHQRSPIRAGSTVRRPLRSPSGVGQPASVALAKASPDYLAAVSVIVRGLFECDEIYYLEDQVEGGSLTVWRGSRRCHDLGAEALLNAAGGHPLLRRADPQDGPWPSRRLSDLRSDDLTTAMALPAARQLLGPHQLVLVLPCGPAETLRGWLLTRSGGDFGDHELAVASTVQPLLAVADRFHRRPADPSGPSTPPEIAATWSSLSPRERQVVDLLVAGLTAQRMGTVLGISPRTVGKHLQNAYDKLGRHDRLLIAVEHRRLLAAQAAGASAPAGNGFAPERYRVEAFA
ncbi:MAG: response regulator transcription factor [Jatrophihabitans sp.]